MNVLHIQSSPRGEQSNSIALTKAFLSASRKLLPEINEDLLNVWDENLPESDATSIGAKYKAVRLVLLTANTGRWFLDLSIDPKLVVVGDCSRIGIGKNLGGFMPPRHASNKDRF